MTDEDDEGDYEGDYEEHDYDAERDYEREVVYEENGGNGTGKWYGDGEGLVERARKSKRRKQLVLATILLLALSVSVWRIGYVIYPTTWVTEPATDVDVSRYCNGVLDCPNSHCGCDGVWIYVSYTRTFAVSVDTNGGARGPYTNLALVLLLASLVAFVWALLILPIGESKEKGRYEPDVADLGRQEIEGL